MRTLGCPDVPSVAAADGFKSAPVLGRIAAELAPDGATPSAGEIAALRVDRPILLEDASTTRFLV